MTGTTVDGQPISFQASDVWSKPLIDAHGVRIGAMFARDKQEVVRRVIRWARGETSQVHTKVHPVQHQSEPKRSFLLEEAPWADAVRKSGQPPNYFMAHGTPNGSYVEVSVNSGTKLFPKWGKVYLNGPEGGEMLETVKNSALAIARNPAGEHVFVWCMSGAANASVGRMAAAYLHSTGTVTGNIYAPTDRIYAPESSDGSVPAWLNVERPADSSAKLFETYPGPGNKPAAPDSS